MKINKKYAAIFLGLLIGASNAFSASVTLSVSQDANVFVPNIAQGTWTDMRIRWQSADDWGRNYPIIQFDLTGLPNNIVVNYARFAFWTYTIDDGGPDWPIDDDFPLLSMYRITNAWTEADAPEPLIDSSAVETQDSFDPGGAGNKFTDPDIIVSNKAAWIFFDGLAVAALVQSWANGLTNNYGVEIQGTGSYTDTSRYFHMLSHDHPTPAVHPYLYVDYTPIPEPATIGIIGLLAAMFFARKR